MCWLAGTAGTYGVSMSVNETFIMNACREVKVTENSESLLAGGLWLKQYNMPTLISGCM